jgi:methyltransferase (TIGR00027 family)
MIGERGSRTAEFMAFFRAMESVRPEARGEKRGRLFFDPLAERFVGAGLRRAVWAARWDAAASAIERYADWRAPGARTSAIARTWLIDEELRWALRPERNGQSDLSRSSDRSVDQVVILGAGFDCRAYRLRELEGIRVFEVDHPSTLATKVEVLRGALGKIPEAVRFVEIDFNREKLPEVLARAGFEASRRTVFLWEGVSNYLTAEAVDSVMGFVAGCGVGSRIIFTYVDAGLLDGSVRFEGGERLLKDVARLGEPWTFGIVPAELEEFLRGRGLCLEGDWSADEYRRKCFGEAAGKMKGYEFYYVAVASVCSARNDRTA